MSDGSRLLPYSSWSSLSSATSLSSFSSSSSTSLSISCCPFYSFSSFSFFFQVIHCSCSLSRDTAARLKSNGRPESHLMEGPQQISSMQTTPSRDRAAISSKPGLLCSICLISMPSYSFFPIFLTLSISLKHSNETSWGEVVPCPTSFLVFCLPWPKVEHPRVKLFNVSTIPPKSFK